MKWLSRKQREEDLEREIRSDLELETEEQQAKGLSPRDARYAARRAFGNTTLVKENTRAMWGWTAFEQILQVPATPSAARGRARDLQLLQSCRWPWGSAPPPLCSAC